MSHAKRVATGVHGIQRVKIYDIKSHIQVQKMLFFHFCYYITRYLRCYLHQFGMHAQQNIENFVVNRP